MDATASGDRVRLSPAPGSGVLALVIGFLLIAALIYQSNAAWLLLWLTGTAVVLSAVAAVRAVRRVRVIDLVAEPVPVGTPVALQVVLMASPQAWAVRVDLPGFSHPPSVPVHPLAAVAAEVGVPDLPRGVHAGQSVRIASAFPLGLISAVRTVPMAFELVVHPRPAPSAPAPPGSGVGEAVEDFTGHARASAGESPRRIDWRAHARGRPLLAKRFAGDGAGAAAELDLDAVGAGDREERLSVLTRWFLDAVATARPVALVLPDGRLAAGSGSLHRRQGLRLLAAHAGGDQS